MRLLAISFIVIYNLGLCQTIDQVQAKIDSLNFAKSNLQRTVSLIDKEIQKQKNLLQTLKGLEFEKSITVTALKTANLLDDRSITNGKIISKAEKGTLIRLISFDGEYYYAEVNNQMGYIYYPYLSELKDIDDFKNFWTKRTNEAKAMSKAEQTDKNKNERLKVLIEKYGYEMASLIINKQLKIGMTEAMVRESVGSPNSKNVSHYSSGTHEQWVYKNKYVYFENGILASWQEDR